ncbi:hypothetical protein DFJ58DRAFT_487567 [Suillus subalutaceus]|uniref:uncharacterized protein n=1 Tax=Suillus subalutaceus TaxID=48586 RepID=UPI001B872BE5|nr:uncharacterized protein DFJ58DRAFT_487567 [Suillus subalutaceus]KAG1846768.1 hypothetical protein DFJ58DRAFT_487567 [Suillus subalutaceus]
MTALALASSSLEPGISRPARKENRIVAFFRSRSRSRSRPHAKSTVSSSAAQSTTDVPTLPMVPASKLRISHVRSTSLAYEPGHAAHTSLAASASQSNSKPGTHTSTRPISSTTTATHSTITPLPSDSIRRRQRLSHHVYSHDYTQGEDFDHQANEDQAASQEDHDRATRSNTPSSLNQRGKLELRSIFGIALPRKSSLANSSRKLSPGSSDRKVSCSSLSQKEAENMPSRKRSFRLNSRPNTPKSTDESRVTKTSTGTIPTPSNPLPLSASPRRLSFGLTSSSRTHTPMTSSGHLPLALPSRHKRHSVGSHDTAHDSAVALPDDHSDSALTLSSHINTRSNSKTSASTLSRFGKSRKGKEHERDTSSSKLRSQARKTPRLDDSRPSVFGSLSEETSPIINLSPPLPQNDSPDQYDLSGLVVSLLPTVEPMSEEDAVEQQPLICAPQARPVIPQIIHTPPTPQRTAELDPPVRPATTPPTLSGGQGKAREVLLSKDPITVHSELPKLHAQAALSPGSDGDPAYSRMRSRFPPRLFGGKDLSRESKKHKLGGRHDPPGAVGPPRNMTNRRIKHGSFDFERPVSGLNRSSSTVDASLVKGEGLTQSGKTGAATHRPTALERTASSSSDRTGKSRKFAYHPTRADSPILAQLSASHTGETSVVSFSSASASAQSKSTGKSAPGPGQSSSWGRASGRRTQRTSHGPFPFEPASSVSSSPLPTSSALPPYPSSPHRQEFDIPEGPASLPPSSPLRSELGLWGGSTRDKSQSARGRVQQIYEQGGKKGKGRSLDLKLGLSWAPNRVRQEAVIHGSLLSQKQEEERNRGKDVTKVFENVLSESGFETFKKYVHRFDAHQIPLEGPRGLLARIEKLLTVSSVSQTEKVELLDQFARFVEGHSEV